MNLETKFGSIHPKVSEFCEASIRPKKEQDPLKWLILPNSDHAQVGMVSGTGN